MEFGLYERRVKVDSRKRAFNARYRISVTVTLKQADIYEFLEAPDKDAGWSIET